MKKIIITLIVAGIAAVVAPASAEDWPMHGKTPDHIAVSPEKVVPPLTKAWEFTTGGPIVSSPIVAGGIVYFGSDDANFYAVDATTGK